MSHLCSVLCVSYNHARFAAAGLQSIYGQTYRNIEIIVLDDGSPDNSVAVIETALEQSPFPTKFIKQSNSGNVPANFNKVLAAASGDFVTMMSLDDILMPDCIENAVAVLSRDQRTVFSANTGHFEIDEHGSLISGEIHLPDPECRPQCAQDLLELEYKSLGAFYIQGQVFRRDILMSIGGFDDTMTGDDIILRTRLFQFMAQNPELKFSLGNNVVLSYRKHGNNLHQNVFRQIKTIVQWKEKYFPGRDYPKQFHGWLGHLINESIRLERPEDIKLASELSPEVARLIDARQRLSLESQNHIHNERAASESRNRQEVYWKKYRRKIKRKLKKLLSLE